MQVLTQKLSQIEPGRLLESSLVFSLIDTQLDGLLRNNVRGLRYANKLLHFRTALYRTFFLESTFKRSDLPETALGQSP